MVRKVMRNGNGDCQTSTEDLVRAEKTMGSKSPVALQLRGLRPSLTILRPSGSAWGRKPKDAEGESERMPRRLGKKWEDPSLQSRVRQVVRVRGDEASA